MGFGLLLIGYSIAQMFTFLGSYEFAGLLIGYFIMFGALGELKKYCPTFFYATVGCVLMLLYSFAYTFVSVDEMLGLGVIVHTENLLLTMEIVQFALGLIFNFALLYGIADLARRVDFEQIRTKAYRNMALVGIHAAYRVFLFLPLEVIKNDAVFLMSLLMITIIAYSLMNLGLFFKCYAFICPQGDEEMPRKDSRFEFVNKWRARNDAKEQETLDYYNKKIEEAKNKRQNNQHKKKKKKK